MAFLEHKKTDKDWFLRAFESQYNIQHKLSPFKFLTYQVTSKAKFKSLQQLEVGQA